MGGADSHPEVGVENRVGFARFKAAFDTENRKKQGLHRIMVQPAFEPSSEIPGDFCDGLNGSQQENIEREEGNAQRTAWARHAGRGFIIEVEPSQKACGRLE
jgi:hypothetical protein